MKLQADIEQMQRAFAEGRVGEAMELKKQINAREAKIEEMKGVASKETLDLADKQKQREIQEAQRVAQEARYKAQEAHEGRMYEQAKRSADISAAAKPTAEERKVNLAMARIGTDKIIQNLAQQARETGLPQDEYETILRRIEARERQIFANQGVKDVPVGVESTIMTASNAKTGEKITSTDGGTTWKDAKGNIVK
jgi:hypothetical protein